MSQTDYISARIPEKLRKRVDDAIQLTNQKESALVRASLEEFLDRHRGQSQIITAVLASVRRAQRA